MAQSLSRIEFWEKRAGGLSSKRYLGARGTSMSQTRQQLNRNERPGDESRAIYSILFSLVRFFDSKEMNKKAQD